LGSGDTAEALGGSGGDWGGDGLEGDERAGPGSWCPCERESLRCECVSGFRSCYTTNSFRTGSTQGDDGNHIYCCVSKSLSTSICRKRTVVCHVAWGGAWAGGVRGRACPLVVPDGGHVVGGGTGVADGTEGLAPAVSEAEDLGGEGAPSTDGLGGGEVGPELLGGWVGGYSRRRIYLSS